MLWPTSLTLELWRQRQENPFQASLHSEFQASQDYSVRPQPIAKQVERIDINRGLGKGQTEKEALTVAVGHAVELLRSVCPVGTLSAQPVELAFLNYFVFRIGLVSQEK